MLAGQSICTAFDNAVEQAKLVLGKGNEHEAEKEKLFKLLKYEEHPSRMTIAASNRAKESLHTCRYIYKKGMIANGPL